MPAGPQCTEAWPYFVHCFFQFAPSCYCKEESKYEDDRAVSETWSALEESYPDRKKEMRGDREIFAPYRRSNVVTRLESQAEKEKGAYGKALAKYTPSAEYQAAIDHLAKAKAKLSGGDKKAKGTEKKKATALKAKVFLRFESLVHTRMLVLLEISLHGRRRS